MVQDANAAPRQRLVDDLVDPRLVGGELGMPGPDAQEWREVVGRKTVQLAGQPGRLGSQHGTV